MTFRLVYLCALLLVVRLGISAQELKLDVSINAPKLANVDPSVITEMEKAIQTFFNVTSFTNKKYLEHEKIEGAMQINIRQDQTNNTFSGDFYFSSSRPVFNSSYYSPTLLIIDKNAVWRWQVGDPIFNNANSHTDQLSAILSYYAYILIGIDNDTFSNLSGDANYRIAQQIAQEALGSINNLDGQWASSNNKFTRGRLIADLLDPRVKSFRASYYDYHMRGCDVLYDNPEQGRAIILSALKSVEKLDEIYSNSMIVKVFVDTKEAELLEVFRISNQGERNRLFDMMSNISPGDVTHFKKLKDL